MDTKHWDDFAATMAEDIDGAYGSSMGKELHFTTARTWWSIMELASAPTSSPNTG